MRDHTPLPAIRLGHLLCQGYGGDGPAIVAAVNAATPLPKWEKIRTLRAEAEYDSVKKEARIAYVLWGVVGIFGGHRFYLGDTARSIAMLFTLGGLGVWALVDVLFIARRVRSVNRSRRAAVMARYHLVDAPPAG